MWASHGPLSIQGGLVPQKEGSSKVKKLVVAEATGNPSTAAISAGTAEDLGGQSVFLQLASGSDCVVLARVGDVPDGAIALSTVQQYNFHVKTGVVAEFRVFRPEPAQPLELVDLEAEVSLLGTAQQGVQVDAIELVQQFTRRYFGRVVAVNEACILEQGGHQLLLRIAAANTLSPEEQGEAVGYHCFRGLVTPDTQIYLGEVAGPGPEQPAAAAAAGLEPSPAAEQVQRTSEAGGATQQPQPSAGGGSDPCSSSDNAGSAAVPAAAPQSTLAGRCHVKLLNARKRDLAVLSPNTVKVVTSDAEWFPVRRKLLRPCIALTKAVRSDEASAEVAVDVDTLTFDRVLIFLEAEALGKPAPGFGIHFIPSLLQAAQTLGLRSLEDYCRKKMGDMESRLQWFSFEEIKRRNAQGECLLILDGMVLDVTRWLPEHPGGATIIPRQSLNIDSSRFFELYHHSRESFLYIQEFYIGEVLPEDRPEIPCKEPSADFMQQLSEYTHFRMRPAKHTSF